MYTPYCLSDISFYMHVSRYVIAHYSNNRDILETERTYEINIRLFHKWEDFGKRGDTAFSLLQWILILLTAYKIILLHTIIIP